MRDDRYCRACGCYLPGKETVCRACGTFNAIKEQSSVNISEAFDDTQRSSNSGRYTGVGRRFYCPVCGTSHATIYDKPLQFEYTFYCPECKSSGKMSKNGILYVEKIC